MSVATHVNKNYFIHLSSHKLVLIDQLLWQCTIQSARELDLFPNLRHYQSFIDTPESSDSDSINSIKDDFYTNNDTLFKCCDTYLMYNSNNNNNESVLAPGE